MLVPAPRAEAAAPAAVFMPSAALYGLGMIDDRLLDGGWLSDRLNNATDGRWVRGFLTCWNNAGRRQSINTEVPSNYRHATVLIVSASG